MRTAAQATALAREIESRPGVRLVGIMAYEGHIAGVGDRVPGKRLRSALIRAMQRASAREIAGRRAEIVAAVSSVTPLEFVNGGGTGSISSTSEEAAVTELKQLFRFDCKLVTGREGRFTWRRPALMWSRSCIR